MADVHNINDYRETAPRPANPPGLKDGDGDGTSSDMEARVAVLESMAKRVESTLDRIDTRLGGIEKSVSDVKEGLAVVKEGMKPLATSDQVTGVATALKDKPSTWQVVIMTLVLSGLTVAAALGGAAKLLGK